MQLLGVAYLNQTKPAGGRDEGEGGASNRMNQPVKHPEDKQLCKWRAPSPGWVKLNVDGAYKEEDGNGGAGMVIRDAEGKNILSACHHSSIGGVHLKLNWVQ